MGIQLIYKISIRFSNCKKIQFLQVESTIEERAKNAAQGQEFIALKAL